MAIGDQLNDLEMVAAVGHGVAMANAPAELQARARYLAPSVLEEGAAAIIEALVLARAGAASAHARSFLAEAADQAAAPAPRRRLRRTPVARVASGPVSAAAGGPTVAAAEPLARPA
jgi:hypothetical protein